MASLGKPKDADEEAAQERLSEAAEKVFQEQLAAAEMYLAENWEEIQAHFQALDRFEAAKKAGPWTAFQNKRNWDEMRKLRGEAKVWLAALEEREEAYKTALRELLVQKQREVAAKEGYEPEGKSEAARPDPFALGWNAFAWPRMEQICFVLTWGLTAIGLCLVLGLARGPLPWPAAVHDGRGDEPAIVPRRRARRSAAIGPRPVGQQGLRRDARPVAAGEPRRSPAASGWTSS